ncbi:VTT domain-containing protein [Lutispora thermophila]|uniref:TVP38/TMEM64 family membrane protein n=1 Tax=Lutispora thermophila DSM 19022 TaxID=1122184 RepID=A0A1M6B6Q5_9FIRM|nr:VTT domain-containing protein [Lutispora thermophila]SHI44421.1 Uncharacterized membrane protein YdjX, TVP38/TMEM64 family, SNARE-associated domain [Lutispora thermophila DSM 19022]
MNGTSQQNKAKKLYIIIVLGVIVVLGIALYFAWPFLSSLGNPDKIRNMIDKAGPWGPLVFILIQILQVLVAPIPGQVAGLAGGYLFGPIWGLIYTMIGATIGFTLIFILTRKFGRPFVGCFVDKKNLDKFDHLIEGKKGKLVIFLIYLLPAFPDDLISFVAGLSTIPIRSLVIISVLGRLPGYAILTFTGHGLTFKNLSPVIVSISILLILLATAWWKRKWLQDFVLHNNKILFIKRHWKKSWPIILLWIVAIIVAAIAIYEIAGLILYGRY